MTDPKPLRTFEDIKKLITRYDLELRTIDSPHRICEEETRAIRAQITQAWQCLASSPAEEAPKLREKIVELGGQLRELEINHKANMQMEERAYEEKLQAAMTRLCRDLIGTLGPTRIKALLQIPPNDESPKYGPDGLLNGLDMSASIRQEAPESGRPRPAQSHGSASSPISAEDVIYVQVEKRKNNFSDSSTIEKCRRLEKKPRRSKTPPSTVKTLRRPDRHGRRRHRDDELRQSQGSEGIVDPTPGEIYLAFWEKSKEWLAVLLLPTQDLHEIGIPGTIESLGLTEKVPSCYHYSSQTGIFVWREEYRDGKPLAIEREFPVMYFDGQDFPAKSAVGWVAAKDLRHFDKNAAPSSLIPHCQSVQEYIEAQAEKSLVETGAKQSDASRTDSIDEEHELHKAPSPGSKDNESESEHPIDAELSASRLCPRHSPAIMDGPTSLPRGLHTAEQIFEPCLRTTGQFNADVEVISIGSSEPGECSSGGAKATTAQISSIAGQPTPGAELNTSPIAQECHTAEARTGDPVSSMALPPSTTPTRTRAAHDIPCPSVLAPTLDNRSPAAADRYHPTLVSGDHCQHALATPSISAGTRPAQAPAIAHAPPMTFHYNNARTKACHSVDGLSWTHTQPSPRAKLPPHSQGTTAILSSIPPVAPSPGPTSSQPLPTLQALHLPSSNPTASPDATILPPLQTLRQSMASPANSTRDVAHPSAAGSSSVQFDSLRLAHNRNLADAGRANHYPGAPKLSLLTEVNQSNVTLPEIPALRLTAGPDQPNLAFLSEENRFLVDAKRDKKPWKEILEQYEDRWGPIKKSTLGMRFRRLKDNHKVINDMFPAEDSRRARVVKARKGKRLEPRRSAQSSGGWRGVVLGA